MTDKQQFETIATELSNSNERNGLNLCESEVDLLAIDLYDAGYRRVEQDYAELLYEYERVSDGLVEAMELVHKIKAKRDVLEQQLADAHKEIARLYKIKLDFEHQITQKGLTEYVGADVIEAETRKETAKEILQEVGKACGDYQWFKNLCKKYGVEVE